MKTRHHPPKNLVPDPVEYLIADEPTARRTTVIVPPELANELGVPELATAKHTATPTHDIDTTDAERVAQDSDQKEAAAK